MNVNRGAFVDVIVVRVGSNAIYIAIGVVAAVVVLAAVIGIVVFYVMRGVCSLRCGC